MYVTVEVVYKTFRGAVQKKLTFLAEMSVNERKKLYEILFWKKTEFVHEEKKKLHFSHISAKPQGGGAKCLNECKLFFDGSPNMSSRQNKQSEITINVINDVDKPKLSSVLAQLYDKGDLRFFGEVDLIIINNKIDLGGNRSTSNLYFF